MTHRVVTADDILTELVKLDRDKRNPLIGTGCVYTAPDETHCIAGQILVNLEIPVPGWDEPGNDDGIEELLGFTPGSSVFYHNVEFTEAAVTNLSRAQNLADSSSTAQIRTSPRRLWGEVIDYITGDLDPE